MYLLNISKYSKLQNGRSSDHSRQSSVLPDLLSQASGSPGTPSSRDKSQSEEVRIDIAGCPYLASICSINWFLNSINCSFTESNYLLDNCSLNS